MHFTYTAQAAADLSGKQYHLVRISAANKCNMASDAADYALGGVLHNKPESGEAATIIAAGPARVMAGAAITAGKHIMTNGSGRAITVTSGNMSCGKALDAAGADGDIIDILVFPPFRWSGAP